MKKRVLFLLTTIFLVLVVTGTAFAEEMPGRVEGTGTQFQLTNSSYKNVTLNSSETIEVFLESVPETISIQLEPVSVATHTQITLGGLDPSTTYYKYEDGYFNPQTFTTDEQGSFSYAQDISQAHLIFIQPRASTIHLRSTGWSKDVGTWDPVTKTATLTTDVDQGIQIHDDDITLEGNGHLISGTYSGAGILIHGRSNITLKNIKVNNFSHGIYLFNSRDITISNVTLQSNTNGLYLKGSKNAGSDNNTIYNNNFLGNNLHAYLDSNSDNNIFNLPMPIGGNYWDNFTSSDLNADKISDVPYSSFGVTDNLPWIINDGWTIPKTTLSASPTNPDGTDGWFKTKPTITLTSNEPGTTYYSWDSSNGPWTVCTGSFQVSDGARNLYYYSVDTEGYAEPVKSQVINVDTVSPTVPVLSAQALNGTEVKLSWPSTTDSTSGVREYQIFDSNTNSLIASSQSLSYTHSSLSRGQTYSYYVKVIDKAGNLSGQSNTVTVTTPQMVSAPITGGSNVEIDLDGSKAIFDQVSEGEMHIIRRYSDKGLPSGYRLVRDSSYEVTTTATYSGPISLTLPYNPDDVLGQEQELKLFHWENNGWINITESIDTVNNTVTGITTSFSPFVVAEKEPSSSPAVGGVAGLPEIFIK